MCADHTIVHLHGNARVEIATPYEFMRCLGGLLGSSDEYLCLVRWEDRSWKWKSKVKGA